MNIISWNKRIIFPQNCLRKLVLLSKYIGTIFFFAQVFFQTRTTKLLFFSFQSFPCQKFFNRVSASSHIDAVSCFGSSLFHLLPVFEVRELWRRSSHFQFSSSSEELAIFSAFSCWCSFVSTFKTNHFSPFSCNFLVLLKSGRSARPKRSSIVISSH